MAIVAFLSAALISCTVSLATSVTITPTAGAVTVRRGEQLQMSCDVSLTAGETPQEVRWYRESDTSPIYGSIDVSSSCGLEAHPCSITNTTDSRGTVSYAFTESNNIWRMTLTIATSTLEDNTTFYCGVLRENKQTSAPISVTVYYLPNTSYPTCMASSHLLGTTPSSSSSVLCSSEITQPVVSLEWTILKDSTRISLSNDSVIVGDQVVNILHLHTLDASYNNSTFTCYMTSEAYPGFNRSCSIEPLSIFPTPTPEVTDRPTSQAAITSSQTGESTQTSEQTTAETRAPDPSTVVESTTDQGQSVTERPTSQAATTSSQTTQSTPISVQTTAESRASDSSTVVESTTDQQETDRPTSQAGLTITKITEGQEIPEVNLTTPEMSYQTGVTGISTNTTATNESETPGQHQTEESLTSTSTSSSDQDTGSIPPFSASTYFTTDAKAHQPSLPYATTPSRGFSSSVQVTTSPQAAVTLPIVIIASAGAAVVVVIIILLVIIACLVASRRTVRKNREDDETSFVFENCEVSANHTTDRVEYRYDGIPFDDFRPTRPPAPPTGIFIPAPPIEGFAPSSECVSLPEYAVVKPRSQRDQPSPEYAVLNPDIDEPSSEIAHGAYGYPSANGVGAGANVGASPPAYAAVAPRSQLQPPTPEYAVLNPDSGEPSPEIPHRAYASPSANNAGTDATAGVSTCEYASYQPGSKWQLPAPDYAVLDADSDDGYAYTLADGSRNEDEALAGDEDERWEQDGQDDERQRIEAMYPDLDDAEIGPGFIAASPKLDRQDADRGKEEKPKGEFCLALPDDTLISEKILGEIESSPKKKKKGKGKPRLDPF